MERCLVGRDGDHLLQPFQCGLYWFRNFKCRDPVIDSQMDTMLSLYIRRVNLDLLLSRVIGTMVENLVGCKKFFKDARFLGIQPNYKPLDLWPAKDDFCFTCILLMIRASQLSGRN